MQAKSYKRTAAMEGTRVKNTRVPLLFKCQIPLLLLM